jgi:hypothetical protein
MVRAWGWRRRAPGRSTDRMHTGATRHTADHTADHTASRQEPPFFNPMPQGSTERTTMTLIRSLSLALALVGLAQATVTQSPPGKKEYPAQVPARMLKPAPRPPGKSGCITVEGAAPGGLAEPAGGGGLPPVQGAGPRDARGTGPAVQCQPDRESVRRILRQAGGSPMTALPIPSTNAGDTYSDSGRTVVLSNYLGRTCPISTPVHPGLPGSTATMPGIPSPWPPRPGYTRPPAAGRHQLRHPAGHLQHRAGHGGQQRRHLRPSCTPPWNAAWTRAPTTWWWTVSAVLAGPMT